MNPVDLELVKLKDNGRKLFQKRRKPMLICIGENMKRIFLTDLSNRNFLKMKKVMMFFTPLSGI